jgi:hypothetical protein
LTLCLPAKDKCTTLQGCQVFLGTAYQNGGKYTN